MTVISNLCTIKNQIRRGKKMSLFGKKMPELVAPTFTDMRIAQNQHPPETVAALNKMGILMFQPDQLSQWAVSTLLMHDDKDLTILPQDAGVKEFKGKKSLSQIHIPLNLMDALIGKGDPDNLLFQFDTWERTRLRVLAFEDGEAKSGLLGFFMEEFGLQEKDFPALIVPDYTGKNGPPGEHFNWYVLLHPHPYNGLDYIVFGEAPQLAQPVLGGVDKALIDTGKIFNLGKAIPGLVKVIRTEEGIRTRYYLPLEVVEATGWWAEEAEGIPSSLPHKYV
jgi:hypothetical protein